MLDLVAKPYEELIATGATQGLAAFFDRIAALTRDPDASFGELRSFYETDDGVRVPPTVFNAVSNRAESV